MNLLVVLLASAAVLGVAYWTYGPILVRLLGLDPNAKTPAYELRDDVDYAPQQPNELLSQHFSAIAAAGPVVGPIFAGLWFGWLPALVWILIGSIFIGGVHDMTALVASIRHKARSITEVVREHMSQRAFLMFLAFIWLALVYIIVAFTDLTAAAFVGETKLDNGEIVSGPGIASSSLMYLVIPVVMGLALRYGRLSVGLATAIFLPLVGLSIWAGQLAPLDLAGALGLDNATAQRVWAVLLLVYCGVASVVPLWLLLQPRGHLGGYFLYAALAGGAIGLVISSFQGTANIEYPQFKSWVSPKGETLFPFLFITIACGACSGFHSLIASGTTSKQLRYETDARVIGYGAMLLEALVAVLSLCCVMRLAAGSDLLAGTPKPNLIYASGIGAFLSTLGIPAKFAVSFGLMAFTTFVYDTLDVCARLGRYIIQELTGWQNAQGKVLGTVLTVGVPMFFVMQKMTGADGNPVPLWSVFWPLFGASNQLLAALTLLGITIWLWRTRRAWWVWLVTGLPTVWMYAMSNWALAAIITKEWANVQKPDALVATYLILSISAVLVVLALLMLVEAVLALWPRRPEDRLGSETAPRPAASPA
jgi:carbon starvation protein